MGRHGEMPEREKEGVREGAVVVLAFDPAVHRPGPVDEVDDAVDVEQGVRADRAADADGERERGRDQA